MTAINPVHEALFAEEIEKLIQDVTHCFPPGKLDYDWQIVVRPGAVDAMRDGGALAGRLWTEVSRSDFFQLDSTGVRVSLSPTGLACYLPLFMNYLLATRGFGWFEDILLPVGFGLEDVVERFSGSSLEDLDNYFRPFYHERVLYVKRQFNPIQCQVVARYIEIAESYGVDGPSPDFLLSLKKYTDFWRNPLSETFKDRDD